jgi:hypothetical protein
MSEKFTFTKDDEKMLSWMKSNPNADGTLGHDLKDGREAVEWYRYFKEKQPQKLPYMVAQLKQEKSYMVPSQWPWWYDIQWTPAESKRQFIIPKVKPEDAAKRLEVVDRLLNQFRSTASG